MIISTWASSGANIEYIAGCFVFSDDSNTKVVPSIGTIVPRVNRCVALIYCKAPAKELQINFNYWVVLVKRENLECGFAFY